MKGKTTMTIIIGLVCVILTAVMFAQFKTISRIDVTALENMQEEELRSEIANWKTKYEEIQKKLEDTNIKIAEYKDNINNNRKTSELLTSELNQAKGLVGLRDVSGSGVVITLKDGEFWQVDPTDLIQLVNELRLAGAEAISINGNRVVYESYIVSIEGKYITMNGGQKIESPYTIKAIGDPTYLESGLSKKQYGYIDTKNSEGLIASLERKDNITINKYNGDLNFEYEQITTEQ